MATSPNNNPDSISKTIFKSLNEKKDAFIRWLKVDPALSTGQKILKYLQKFLGVLGVIALSPIILLAVFIALVAAL